MFDYFRFIHAVGHTVFVCIRIHLPFFAGRSLLAWDIWEESCVALHCVTIQSEILDVTGDVLVWTCLHASASSPGPPFHTQYLFSKPGSSPPSFQIPCFFSKSLLIFKYVSPFSRLGAHSFASLNGLGVEHSKSPACYLVWWSFLMSLYW